MNTPAHPSDDVLALDVVVPVYNEQGCLEVSVLALHAYLTATLNAPWRISIVNNGSTDDSPAIADRLALSLNRVVAIHMLEKGRGRALKRAWLDSPAQVLAYVDVDLSTELDALPPLIAPLLSGHSDIAIGTRLAHGSRVVRGAKREFVSRSYNLLLRSSMSIRFSDAQCGFKAIRRDVASHLLPLVEDDGWFFDTELLIIAERSGLRIHEVPVDWIDDPDSKVDIVATMGEDMKGLLRVSRSIMTGKVPVETIYAELGRRPFSPSARPGFFGQVVRFGAIGAASTAAYGMLYLLLQGMVSAQGANFLALLLTAVANTAANRRFTFGVRGPARLVTDQFQGLLVFAAAWVITGGSLLALQTFRPGAGSHWQLVVLTAANLFATALRFVLLRAWVFRRQRRVRLDPTSATSLSPVSKSARK